MDVNRRISEQTQEHPLCLEPRHAQAWKQNRGRWVAELSGVVKAGVVEAKPRWPGHLDVADGSGPAGCRKTGPRADGKNPE